MPARSAIKPVVVAVAVFVVLASLTMHASNGFLHAIFGEGASSLVHPLDIVNAVLITSIGQAVTIFLFGMATGLVTGLSYWIAARKPRPIVPNETARTAPERKRRPVKPRNPEQVMVDPSRVARVMGLANRTGDDSAGRSFQV